MKLAVFCLLSLCLVAGTTPAQAPYCTSTHTGFSCATPDEYIASVAISSLTNNTVCGAPPGYTDYTGLAGLNLTPGSGSAITVVVGQWYDATDQVTVFCDWDGNNLLTDAGEAFPLTQGAPGASVTYTGTITPPLTSVASVRVRVVLNWGVPASCGATFYGETEDYTGNAGAPECLLVFSSPNGPGSIQVENITCPSQANNSFIMGVTLAAGVYPNGWFFGLDVTWSDLVNQYNTGFPFSGTLDANGYSNFGPTGPGALPSGLQIWAVTAQWTPGFGVSTGARPPVTYTIP